MHVSTFLNRRVLNFSRFCEVTSLTNNTIYKTFYRSLHSTIPQYRNFRSPIKFTVRKAEVPKINCELVEEELNEEDEFHDFIYKNIAHNNVGHQVLVVQPIIKPKQKSKRNTTPELQLLESVTLIKTLRDWRVVGEAIIKVLSFNKKYFFGKGNLQALKELIENNKVISAVFLSVETLTVIQQTALQEIWNVPVFDRYTIIMHIFREHATTKEAKLQIKAAELHYMSKIIKGFNYGLGEKFGGSAGSLGEGIKPVQYRREVLKDREGKIRRELLALREQRLYMRKNREKRELPVVAVVGYTNAGKTSLIKVLTGKESLEPKDYLFATLDVTCHAGQLPSNLNVLFIDTLGFISDIPTHLIESFIFTLEDAIYADVIIHVRDISHPDTIAQNDNVLQTLRQLTLPNQYGNKIITVGNKIDKIDNDKLQDFRNEGMILVSCSSLIGIDVLRQEIDQAILLLSDKKKITIRVKSGSEEYNWLQSEVTVVDEIPDYKNNQYMLMKVIISPSTLARFKSKFINNYKAR